ncbi:hypothetical protein LSM04_004252 [Trypanosoma melophagium]|uniref:uncharacterized protein n=1 Tax=Trypanosoma melophagium TaxID=715481 RepID=UPI00351A1AFE|nr:hypothetical protein LSM04_004252 [Trypanosoma melophagium]
MPRNRQERHTAGLVENLVRHGPRAPKAPTGGGTRHSAPSLLPRTPQTAHPHTPTHARRAGRGPGGCPWLDRHAAAVDARAVGVGKQRHDVRLCGLLRREDRAALEAQTLLLCTRHLTHQTLERRLCSSRSVERWNWRISRSATVPGRQRAARASHQMPHPPSVHPTPRTRRWNGASLQQQVSGALELADLTQRHGPRTPAELRPCFTPDAALTALGAFFALRT